jgi:hypothetical protein
MNQSGTVQRRLLLESNISCISDSVLLNHLSYNEQLNTKSNSARKVECWAKNVLNLFLKISHKQNLFLTLNPFLLDLFEEFTNNNFRDEAMNTRRDENRLGYPVKHS